MQDRPSAAELLDAVRGFIESEVIPALEGRRKFHARVAANVLAIVGRELAAEEVQLDAEWQGLSELLGDRERPRQPEETRQALRARNEELCARIRAGEADAGPFRDAVLRHVRRIVRDKLAVVNPAMLAAESERETQP
jgi:hypothetical protein